VARVRGILPPVGELVGVGVEDGIEAKRLHGAPWIGTDECALGEDSRRGRLDNAAKSGEGYPPPGWFLAKSAELLENKRVAILASAKECAGD
jgi:hypothetical protein